MTLPTLPRVRDDLIFRHVEEDFVVYDPVSDRTALLNVSAAAVLDFCDGTRTVEGIASEVASVLSLEVGNVVAEVESSLNEFLAQGFLEQKPERNPET